MAYPSAPWTLRGYAVQSLQPLEVDQVRSKVPAELEIVSLWPGKTVGGIYVASYGIGSVLTYNELIVVSALTRSGSQLGIWISHIYVDNPDSVAGGREIWDLPKELALFDWSSSRHPGVVVRQGDRVLCSLQSQWQMPGVKLPISMGGFSKQNASLKFFDTRSKGQVSLLGANWQVPYDSPFTDLGLGQPWLSFYCDQLNLLVQQPVTIR